MSLNLGLLRPLGRFSYACLENGAFLRTAGEIAVFVGHLEDSKAISIFFWTTGKAALLEKITMFKLIMEETMNTIFDRLNPAQMEAVTHINGPMLVIAGAGSGKTRVLTSRIAYLLQQGVSPYHILAITFTNKAAAEMKDRVHSMVGDQAKDIWLSTFHAFCARLLRYEIDHLPGYSRNFVFMILQIVWL